MAIRPQMVTIDDMINENRSLKEALDLLNQKLNGYEIMRQIEKKRDGYVREVVKAAVDPNVAKETVMEFVTECARSLYEVPETGSSLRAILYQIRPMTGRSYDLIKNGEGIEGSNLNDTLYCMLDTNLSGNGKSFHVLPEEKRILSIKKDTVTGDSYLLRMPVTSLNDGAKPHDVKHIHQGTYDKSRWPDADQRAAFPFINPISSKVEYILVIDKGGESLTDYDIRFVRDFVRDASNVLAIKQVIEEDRQLYNSVRQGLHNLSTAIMNIEGYLELLHEKYPAEGKIPKLEEQFDRFKRVIRQVRKGEKIHDLAQQDLKGRIAEIADSFRKIQPRIEVIMDFPGQDLDAYYDKYVMTDAIENILRNSSETDAIDKRIEICLRPKDEGYVMLTIKDNCGGIEPELFGAIMQRPGITSKTQGSGIGVNSAISSLRECGCLVDVFNNYHFGLEYQVLVPKKKPL